MKVKFLIIRFSSIGDIVLTSPVVRCLKQQVENSEVHFVTKQRFAPLMAYNPYVDKVHALADDWKELILKLKAENFHYIIDLHNNIRSRRIKFSLGIPSFTFNKLNLQKYLLVNFRINYMPEEHIVDRYMEPLNALEVINDGKGLDFFIPEKFAFKLENLPVQFRSGYLAFVMAGTWNTKKLPVSKMIKIINSIEIPVVLLGGKDEQRDGDEVQKKSRANVVNLAGKLSLHQSASLIRDARLVLTNDTGLMHIAAAYKKKILSFWGNTIPQFGMTPYMADPASEQMEVPGLKCRPCSKLGYHSCPKGHFRCMNNQSTENAISWINRELL